MLDNNSQVQCFEYRIDLEKPVGFFCTLAYQIASNASAEFNLRNLFSEDFFNQIEASYEETENGRSYDLSDVKSRLALFMRDKVIENLDDLGITDVLFVYKTDRLIFCHGDAKKRDKVSKNSLTSVVQKFDLFKVLAELLSDRALGTLIKTLLSSIRLDEQFSSAVKIIEKDDVFLPFLPSDFIDNDRVEADIIDSADVWVNVDRFGKIFKIKIDPGEDVYIVRKRVDGDDIEQRALGIRYNNFLLPLSYDSFSQVVKEEEKSNYYWLLFCNVFQKGKGASTIATDQILTEFKEDIKNAEFSALLSNLRNNHYLQGDVLNPESPFSKYFERVSFISELKHVAKFNFFVSEANGKTALGIYTNEKIEDDYLLLHWVSDGNIPNKHHHFRNETGPVVIDKSFVWTLKPQIAFYFVSKYFENMLEATIASETADYLANFELFVNSKSLGEIDFLIKSGGKLCFIEAKTKLNDTYIEEWIEKCDRLIDALSDLPIQKEFYIISAYSDQTCERKGYFIDQSQRVGYNQKRDGLATIPYYFTVPIPRHKETVLTCIAEPDAERLKVIINEICQN